MCSGVRELEFGSVHVMRTGARKMADLKLADLKMKDQIVRKMGEMKLADLKMADKKTTVV